MHLPSLIVDLALILCLAAIVTFIFRIIRQPVVLGYIVAGVLVGPHTPAFFTVVDMESIRIWAELGVIFLMFSLGLEFSFRRLAKVGISAGGTAIFQILTMLILGLWTGHLLGWSRMEAAFLGCMISISSTTIIIKAFEEQNLKTRRFVELVFGMLIVEDLAAMLILVALSTFVSTNSLDGMNLLLTAGKLSLVVGAWVIVGMFALPRFVKSVGRKGSNEMMIVTSVGLCLALVVLADFFNYSVALGAFIMGSILAETREVHRIENLLMPLKDIFGAVFFVSIGMMLNPSVVIDSFGSIVAISLVVIVGKILSVTAGSIVTGQSISTSVNSGLSMAQIGEFSFIIATLGIATRAIDEKIYGIIIATSLITTFTTPYFIRLAPQIVRISEEKLPQCILKSIDRYGSWFEKRATNISGQKELTAAFLKWTINAVVATTIFALGANLFWPWLEETLTQQWSNWLTWFVTFIVSAPFLWAMLTAFRRIETAKGLNLLAWLASLLVLGVLNLSFFNAWIAVALTIGFAIAVTFFSRGHLEMYYQWYEKTFLSGIARHSSDDSASTQQHDHLVPWDAHLAEVQVPANSALAGRTLLELAIREKYAVNVVVLQRAGIQIVAPSAEERLFPGDSILCFGRDEQLEKFQNDLSAVAKQYDDLLEGSYMLRPLILPSGSPLVQSTVRDAQINKNFHCLVVGLERAAKRLQNPPPDYILHAGDLIWVVGSANNLKKLKNHIASSKIETTQENGARKFT